MGSSQQSSLQGGAGLFGSGTPISDPKRLIVYSTKDQMKNSILANWVNADKITYWQLSSSTYASIYAVYNEIVIMPFDQIHMKHLQLDRQQEREVYRFMLEDLPLLLAPGGRIIDMNDLNEEQNEPQGLSGQADAGEPDAS